MRWTAGDGVEELLPPPYPARSRVHEYGGGEFLVAGGVLYFVNNASIRTSMARVYPGGPNRPYAGSPISWIHV